MTNIEINPLAPRLKELFATPEVPELGPRQRDGVLPVAELNARLENFFHRATAPRETQALIRCAALLWHDHLDASHEISQAIGTPDGSFLHGIMHRREPDYGNAKYWFRRTGPHHAYPAIARAAGEFLAAQNETALATRLAPRGQWDAFAFVDACEEAAQRSASEKFREQLRAVQQIEFNILFAHFCSGLRGAA